MRLDNNTTMHNPHVAIASMYAVCGLVTYQRVRTAKPGLERLNWALPVIALHFYLPYLAKIGYGGYLATSVVFLQTTFLGTFKVLALCLNRGPLCDTTLNFWQFQLLLATPLYPKQGAAASEQVQSWRELLPFLAASGFKVALLQGLVYLLTEYTALPLFPRYTLWTVAFYLLLSLVLDSAAPFSVMLLGLPLQPSFDQPHLSTSFRQLWSRRWNLTISCTLRDVLYEPLSERRWVRPPPDTAPAPAPGPKEQVPAGADQGAQGDEKGGAGKGGRNGGGVWRKHVGAALVFFVSGVMHELWLRYFCGRFVGLHLAFFTLQVPLIAAQDLLVARLPPRVRGAPWCRALRWASTVGGGLAAAYLFWSACEQCGVAEGLWDLRTLLLPWLPARAH